MTPTISRSQLFAFRARRQYLAPEARGHTPEGVFEILKALQPVQPIAGGMPGTAPHPRTRMVDYEDDWTERWRASDRLIKGRFMHGNVAYVAREDLALYAAAFRRPMREPMPILTQRVLDAVQRHGPILKSALQDLTGLERGRFNRALTALNLAFEVMELQRTLDWDSPWDLYQRVYPDSDYRAWDQADAQTEVLWRFTRAFGPATTAEMVDWSGWPTRRVGELLDRMLRDAAILGVEVEARREPAYLASDDIAALEGVEPTRPFLVVLPANDPLVLPQWSWVKAHYRSEPLPYCLGVIVEDGDVVGAAWGHYKRRYAHIEELNLEPDIVHIPPRVDAALAALEFRVSGGYVPICIYGINGPADAPWTDEILTRNGYVWQSGYYVKDFSET